MPLVVIPMPKVGQTMEEGTLIEWLVEPGQSIAREDVIAAIETDKLVVEIETFAAGTVTRLLVEPGEVVSVGTPICELESDDG